MKQKVKAAIGANVLGNPYINRTYNKSFNAQRSTNNYIKKIANSKKIGSTISGITTGIAGIALGQPGLVKTGISDVVDGLSSTPLDNTSIQSIYGSGNMQNLSQYSGGIDPTVGAGLKGLVNSYNFNMAIGGYVGKKSGKTLKSPALDLSVGNSYETDKGNSLDVNAALGLWKGSKSGVQQDLRLVGNAKPNINNYKAGLQFNTVAGGVNNRSKFEFPSNIEVGLEQYNRQYRPYLSNRIEWNKKRGTISKNDTYGLYSKQVLGGFGYAGKEYRDDKYINNQFVEGKVSDRFSKKPLGAQVLLGVHGSKEILPNMVLSGETYTDLIPDLLNASKNISTYGDYTNPKFGGNIKLTYKIPYNKARIKTPGHTPTPVTSGQYKNTRLFSDYARGGKIKFNPGGIFDIPTYDYNQLQPIGINRMQSIDYNTPNIIGAQATPYTDKLTRKPIIQNAGDFLSTVNPLGLGSKLQNVGMDEYGVIENDAAYIAGSILNPIGAFANWAGNGFHGNTYMKDKRGQMLQNMTAENMSNEVGEKNVIKYGIDYDRLNRFNNRGNVTTMNMAKGGGIPPAVFTNPNDPEYQRRLKSYNDSLNIYNYFHSLNTKRNLDIYNNDMDLMKNDKETFNKYWRGKNNNNKMPIDYLRSRQERLNQQENRTDDIYSKNKGLIDNPFKNPFGYGNYVNAPQYIKDVAEKIKPIGIMDEIANVYKKPLQPIILKNNTINNSKKQQKTNYLPKVNKNIKSNVIANSKPTYPKSIQAQIPINNQSIIQAQIKQPQVLPKMWINQAGSEYEYNLGDSKGWQKINKDELMKIKSQYQIQGSSDNNPFEYAKGGLVPLSATSGTLVGPKHAQGGIDINPQVEAEGGEVMNAQPDGSAQIFSKQDGYADVVKPLLKQKGVYEQQLTQLLPVKEAMLKSFGEETDGLRRASLGRNLEKINTDIFKYTQIVQQIDAQVQQIFAQQQEQNGNNGMQQMRHGGLLAKRGIEIPPFTPNSNGINWNNYRTIAGKEFTPPIYNNVYRIDEENNSPLNNIPQPMGFIPGSIKGSPYYNSNEAGKGFNTDFIYEWRYSDAENDDDTNNWLKNDEGLNADEYLLAKRISRVIPNMQSKQGYVIHTPYYTVPFDESLIDTNTPIAETPTQTKQRRSFRPNIDLSKYAGKFKNIQDVMIPAIELAEQSKLSNKMEAIQAPQSDLLQYNPIDVRYTPDYELNKLQSNMNTTIQEIRRNSSNPYYANALRNQLFKDNINTTGNIIDKVNKDNLNIAIQNNAGFNRVNEANNTIRFNNKQLNYEKAIGDLERRSDIVKTGIMRTREFMNNSRQYDLDVARLGVEGVKYADTIGGKYSDAYITGQLNNIAEQNKTFLSNLANKEKLSEQEHLILTNQIPLYVDYVNKGNEVDGNILRLFTRLGYNKVNGKWVK